MSAVILFIITSAGLYFLVRGTKKSINQEEGFFDYLYSTLVLTTAIGLYIYFAFSDFWSSRTSIEDITWQLTTLWLISSLVPLVVLIRNAVIKKPILIPGVISSVAFMMFSITITIYITMRIF